LVTLDPGALLVEVFPHDIQSIASLDNSPSSVCIVISIKWHIPSESHTLLKDVHLGLEEGPVERVESNVPANGTSVHVKSTEEVQFTDERGRGQVRLLPLAISTILLLTDLERSKLQPR